MIGLIALAVVIMTPPDSGPRFSGRKIRLEDLVSIHFKPKKFNRTWVSGKTSTLVKSNRQALNASMFGERNRLRKRNIQADRQTDR